MGEHYILDGKTIVSCDLLTWARWFERGDRTVALTNAGAVRVSTVFLGMNHQFGEGPPLLFETMVFGGERDERVERYATWAEAEAGHEKMCQAVFGPAESIGG